MIRRTLISSVAFILAASPTLADVSTETVKSLSAPSTIDTRAGKLEFRDGVPTEDAAQKIYDTLDFTRALNVYNNSFRGASALAIVKGVQAIGAKPGDVVIFSNLMDSSSLFLTANADTVYYFTGLDLSKGPMVIEQPSGGIGGGSGTPAALRFSEVVQCVSAIRSGVPSPGWPSALSRVVAASNRTLKVIQPVVPAAQVPHWMTKLSVSEVVMPPDTYTPCSPRVESVVDPFAKACRWP